jgi:hypothetical protein
MSNEIELTDRQRGATEAYRGTICKEVFNYRWDVGNTDESPIMNGTIKATPTVVLEVLYKWLDENDKVLMPHGPEKKENVVQTHLKPALYKQAAIHLDNNNKVLLPSGETVDISRVTVEEKEDGS